MSGAAQVVPVAGPGGPGAGPVTGTSESLGNSRLARLVPVVPAENDSPRADLVPVAALHAFAARFRRVAAAVPMASETEPEASPGASPQRHEAGGAEADEAAEDWTAVDAWIAGRAA